MKPRRSEPHSRRWILRQVLYGLGLSVLATVTLVFTFTGQYDVAVGSVATQDIFSPRDITFVSAVQSLRVQDEARRQIAPVYTGVDFEIARQQLARIRQVLDYLSALRADTYATEAQKRSWALAVPELGDLSPNDIGILLALPDTSWTRVQLEARSLLDQIMRREEIRSSNVVEIRERLPVLVPLDIPQDEANLIVALVKRFVVPNSFLDQSATDLARENAAQAVGPMMRVLRTGEIIVRSGSVISESEMEALEELGLTLQRHDWQDIALKGLLAITATLLLGLYLMRLQPEVLRNARQEGVLFLVVLVFMVLARLLVAPGQLLLYLFPIAALGMLLTTTTGYVAAVGGVIYVAFISGLITGSALHVTLILLANGLTAALVLPRYEQTASIFRCGLLGGIAGAIMRLIFVSSEELLLDPFPFLVEAGVSVAGGVVGGGLTLGGLFLLAPFFDLITTFRLVELSHPNHPLLQRLLREAPGTFHHTMMIASMAEQAAERVGANALLTRAGTYYHDVGKLARPYFFIENQSGLSNPHDRLDPQTSADIVIGHVTDGLKLARQYGLPERIRAFISEHHGTMRASFFYRKALNAAGGEAGLVDEALFRYPGPRPQSVETALTMLADSSEAATRAARPTSADEIARVVNNVFEERTHDGQLSECPITLEDLELVKATYVELLRGAYHPRIQYPETKDKTTEEVKA
ncbi:MAG: 7TM-HD extracellular [Chloroflexi bacterium ADurb.Bin360]|nr:MAG: 7TM-HD extracellular [Chloroflexi bacterium ADurb.Bin360]